MRVYHDASVSGSNLQTLKELGVELEMVGDSGGGTAGMFWRFYVAADESVDRWLVRDSDSRLNQREKAAVDEWMKSNFSIHSLRDHPNHNRMLNGGMWGGVKGAISNMKELTRTFSQQNYAADLHFLSQAIVPIVKGDILAHDSYSCEKWENSHPYPTKRPDNLQHVGQVENNFCNLCSCGCESSLCGGDHGFC